jgi:hypothetical protein
MVTTATTARDAARRNSLPLALASAAASAPAVAGLALAVSLVAVDNIGWSAAAGFASGALLRRADRRLAAAASLALAAWFATRAAPLTRVEGRFGFSECWWDLLPAATAVPAFVAGFRPWRGIQAAIVVSVVALVIVVWWPWMPSLELDCSRVRRCAHLALAGGGVLAASLAARGRTWASLVVLVLAAIQFLVIRNNVDRWAEGVDTPAAAALMPATWLAGAMSADLVDGVRGDAGVRLVALVQRRPWITSLAVASAVIGLCGPWTWRWYAFSGYAAQLTTLPLLLCAFAFLAHIGRGGRATSDRAAPWLAANVAGLALAWVISRSPASDLPFAVVLGVAVAASLWPLVSVAVLPGAPPGDLLPLATTVLPAAMLTFPAITAAALRSDEGWPIGAFACLPLAPLAFHAAVRGRLRSWMVVGAAAACGFVWRILTPLGALPHGTPSWPLLAPVVWTLAGVLVVAARRVRSMTAVPLDHPAVADFGGP